jgi:putative two-component system hydrogenase maturation factor HypX/HoxX
MKILFLTTAFNGMAQRAWIELDRLDHQVKVVLATDDEAMQAGVEDFKPELIVAPFLKKKIPTSIWKNYTCFVIHPGIKGDRGASSLDWAILGQKKEWGVTILQAAEKMDSGHIWAYRTFPMRQTSKAALYRQEVTQAAMEALLEAIENFQNPDFRPLPLDYEAPEIQGKWKRSTRKEDYQFDWSETSLDILTKINAADSFPGAPVDLEGKNYRAFGCHIEEKLKGQPGEVLAQRNKAICMATGDGAIWITHLQAEEEGAVKLPATMAMGEQSKGIAKHELSPFTSEVYQSFREINYEEEGPIGYLSFDFYNGAMDADQCDRLRNAIIEAKKRPIKILVLLGGDDLWSNGIDLNVIEAAANPADEAWRNINAIDDLILEIIESPDHYIIAALQGNAGGGGVPLALAADKILARRGIVLNPHTKNMGLYGSEYRTYLLPKRIGVKKANLFTEKCLPWGTDIAKEIGLIDDTFAENSAEFRIRLKEISREMVQLPYFDKLLMAKKLQRKKDERIKPLAQYREEELKRMWANFYENDEEFSEKRFRFIHKIPDVKQSLAVENRDWYSSRRKIYRRRKWESIEYESLNV